MKLGRPRRPGRALAALGIVALVSVTGRGLWSNGVFSSAKTGFFGTCRVAATLPGVQDMEAANGTIFLSVGSARGPGADDGIYALTLPQAKPVRLAGAPKDFHPRGIGLYKTPDGKGLFLYAVNKRSTGKFSVDSFEVTDPATAPKLVAQGTIEGGLLVNPQDVAVSGPGSFYVANGTASSFAPIHWLQTYGIIPGGNILYFNGMSFKEVADGLYGTRSLVLTPDGSHVIVGGLLSRALTTFTREAFTGALTEADTRLVGAGPEKLSLDAQGQLLAAGHANLFDWRAMTGSGKRAASQIFHLDVLNGLPQAPEQVYGDDGAQIAGASVAVTQGKTLLIGSSLDGRLLSCIVK